KLQIRITKAMKVNDIDAFVYPHQQQIVAKIGEEQKQRNGILASLIGLPAITVPAGFSEATKDAPLGVPIGIEFMCMPWKEEYLLKIAYLFEKITNSRTPPIL